jgi:SprT protein
VTTSQKIEHFSKTLQPFLPPETEGYVANYLVQKVVHFTVSKDRKTKLGDYHQPHNGKPHRISVNGSLNKYAFLITTLHEIAHLTTFEKYGNRVKPHGSEWKAEFKIVFEPILKKEILPKDVTLALNNYLTNAKASSCSDDRLSRVLRRYDKKQAVLVEHLEVGTKFELNGKIYLKGDKLRKRHECLEVRSGKKYRVLGLVEIDKLIDGE